MVFFFSVMQQFMEILGQTSVDLKNGSDLCVMK